MKFECEKGQILVEHENGYYGCLYGKSSMSIFKGNEEILHTGSRTINTAEELYEKLGEMPEFLKMLSQIKLEDLEEDCDL